MAEKFEFDDEMTAALAAVREWKLARIAEIELVKSINPVLAARYGTGVLLNLADPKSREEIRTEFETVLATLNK